MSGNLFGRLIEHAAQRDDPVANDTAGRWIKRLSVDDADLMAKAVVKPVIVTRQIRLVRIEFGEELYFCTFGLPESEEALSGLSVITATPGIFALAVLEAGIRPGRSITAAMIKDQLDSEFKGNGAGYEGHDLESIAGLFPPVIIYQATEALEYHGLTERVLGSILARTYLDGPIMLEPETVALFVKVFEHDSRFIPFRNLVQGILSISWENLFIEVYRCVEQLYALPRAAALKAALPSQLATRELARLLETHLAWHPKELEAFRALVQLCDEATISAICAGLDNGAGDTHVKRCESAVQDLYELRNRIVHYRPAHDVIQKSDGDWNIVIKGMLEIVAYLYNTYATDFFGAADAVSELWVSQ